VRWGASSVSCSFNLFDVDFSKFPSHRVHPGYKGSFEYNILQECEDLMARGLVGTGAGFDAPAAGKIGGRWRNPSPAESRNIMLKVNPSTPPFRPVHSRYPPLLHLAVIVRYRRMMSYENFVLRAQEGP
jgi:hypothetical protein